MKTAATLVIAALSATPALAGGTRGRVSLELVVTPDAEQPFGFGASVDVLRSMRWGQKSAPMLGGGARLDVFGDKAVQLTLAPILGAGLQPAQNDCLHYLPSILGDVRPGLALRTRGGPALSLAASVEGGPNPLVVRGRIATAVALVGDPRREARVPGRFQDPTASVGAGLAVPLGGCLRIVDGRPLRHDHALLLAEASSGALPPLAARWLDRARDEHAAVGAFARLAAELQALDAPDALVAACHHAAAQEAVHARACLQRAADHAGRPLSLGALRTHARDLGDRATALRTLAWESWHDGVINEGHAADQALRDLLTSDDPADRAVHARIAVEERDHARLGLRVVRWCGRELARA